MKRWEAILRGMGIAGLLGTYLIYTTNGESMQALVFVILAIGTLVMPEFIEHLPVGPSK